MNLVFVKDNSCDFCGTCVGVCPENCIELKEMQISIDHNICTNCSKCVWICPVEALYQEIENEITDRV